MNGCYGRNERGELASITAPRIDRMDQREIAARGFNIAHWFGVRCDKCCDLYPRFRKEHSARELCWYECDECGRRTARFEMPWQAERAWNVGEFEFEGQRRLF